MFGKVLVPIDGSRESVKAAEYAADLCRKYGGAATLLFAADLQSIDNSPTTDDIKASIAAALREANQQMLSQAALVFRNAGVPVETRQRDGAPASVIADEAMSGGYDLVVMGSRGLTQQDQEFSVLGSVTDRVLRRVSCPVLVVR